LLYDLTTISLDITKEPMADSMGGITTGDGDRSADSKNNNNNMLEATVYILINS